MVRAGQHGHVAKHESAVSANIHPGLEVRSGRNRGRDETRRAAHRLIDETATGEPLDDDLDARQIGQ